MEGGGGREAVGCHMTREQNKPRGGPGAATSYQTRKRNLREEPLEASDKPRHDRALRRRQSSPGHQMILAERNTSKHHSARPLSDKQGTTHGDSAPYHQ